PEGDGRHRLRACPGKPYAYHRVLDTDQGSDRGSPERPGPRHDRQFLRLQRADRWPDRTGGEAVSKVSTDRLSKDIAMATATHDIKDPKRGRQGAVQLLKQELGGLRTGRASASLLDPVQVEAYGSHMPLNQLATISVPEPRLLSVQVWDKSMVHAVEKAIS